MSDVDPVIRFKEVSKTFKRPDGRGDFVAVDRLSFEIAKGEIVAVLGKTGCGKSTMFNIVAGLIEASSGEVKVIGRDPFREFDFFRGKIGIVFQNDRLMPWRTAFDNVRLGLQILDTDPEHAEDTARAWLKRLGLSGHENDYPHALSAACVSECRSRVRLRSIPKSCCATSPFHLSTRSLHGTYVPNSSVWYGTATRPPYSLHTRLTKPWRLATVCWCFIDPRASLTRRESAQR